MRLFLQEALTSAGFDAGQYRIKADVKKFNPHLTLLKTSRAKNKKEQKTKITQEMYDGVADLEFGTQGSNELKPFLTIFELSFVCL